MIERYLMQCDKRFESYINSMETSNLIKESVKYTFLNGGKRLRLQLYISLLMDLGNFSEELIDIGIAIEMIHTYSLIHDDLPAMDDDDTRRGKLANHKVFGEGMAILAGDALLTHSFDLVAKSNIKSDVKIQIIREFVSCAGMDKGMINGQVLDLQNENNVEITLRDLESIHLQKTARLIYLPLYCAAEISEKNDMIVEIENVADKLGLYYQVQDDYLDVYGNQEEIGKKIHSDRESGKKTYADFYTQKQLEELLESMEKEFSEFIKDKENLQKIISIIINRRN